MSKEPIVPAWAKRRFTFFRDQVRDLVNLLHLSIEGISRLQHAPELTKALVELAEIDGDPVDANAIERSERQGALAKSEVELGFPLLHAQATVTLWSFLEVLVRDVVADRLENQRELLSEKPVRGIRIRVGDYETMDPADRPGYLAELLESEVGAPLRQGAGRFEALLAAVGLDGEISKEHRETLFELAQVRNVIAHRAGIADRRFVDTCPSLCERMGDPIVVSHEMFTRYARVAAEYAGVIVRRVCKDFGGDFDDLLQRLSAEGELQNE